MLHSAYGLLVASGGCSWRRRPQGIDPEEIGRAMAAQPGVVEVHDLHVWEVTSGFPALSAHVVVQRRRRLPRAPPRAGAMLHERFEIHHTTLQVDHEAAAQAPIQIEVPRARGRLGP